ncbi:hypothetical protein J4727_11110, partial [Providencia rettgeri]|nr:hypothetical protein [Providencia rettgeri]
LIREDTVCSIKKSIFLRSDKITKKASFVYISLMSMLTSPKLFFLSQGSVAGGRSLFLLVYLQSNVNI